ncbi:ABC transporter ATP-binding protein [Segeticoccus rhizosphaerae]|jgi:oligopeptide/dipeptide ABC transporter ATP-binding protein|uniref:ABC transporter ATP-binding protein n=1 Tax=Segeticoccus rhizosphaerae TaxID=1104777 RepID=UPI0010C134F9|nr:MULTISPECIES: ABC transporter ATP-binding protein [Intrasporangiaceae]
MSEPVLEISGLRKYFDVDRSRGGGKVYAVDGVDLSIGPGEMVGLVGESGSGKSTVGKCVVRLLEPTAGSIKIHGRDVTHLRQRSLRHLRRQVHMVFQDPHSSLNPRMQVGAVVAEPLRMHRIARGKDLTRRVDEMLERVGLGPEMRSRYPHELSGGQRQRVGLARSLVLEPSLLIADEPVSALDVSVQASIINLLLDLQRDMGFSCLFIAHDLAAVEFLCNRVAVMYLGRIVEESSREELFKHPRHPYSQSLLSAIPLPDPPVQRERKRVVLTGDIPSPVNPPSGCHFHTRCPVAELPLCRDRDPELIAHHGQGHRTACHLVHADGTAPDITKGAGPLVHHET